MDCAEGCRERSRFHGCGLALTGIPNFLGFGVRTPFGCFIEAFTSAGIVHGVYVWLLLSATVFLTALYVGRQMFLTFGGGHALWPLNRPVKPAGSWGFRWSSLPWFLF